MRLYLDSCVLIDALDGAEQLRRHTLQQLERYADAEWVISDLVHMECLVGPLRSADQIRLLAFRKNRITAPRAPLPLAACRKSATASFSILAAPPRGSGWLNLPDAKPQY